MGIDLLRTKRIITKLEILKHIKPAIYNYAKRLNNEENTKIIAKTNKDDTKTLFTWMP